MRLCILATTVLVGAAALAQAQDIDAVYVKSKSEKVRAETVRGSITAISPAAVTVTLKDDTTQPVPVNEIDYVQFAGEPRVLKQARVSIRNGDFAGAAEVLGKLEPEEEAEITRDEVKQEIAYYQALSAARLALAGNGELLAAAKAMIAFLTANKDSYHFYEGSEVTGDIATAVAAGNASSADAAERKNAAKYYASAQKYYTQLAAAPWPEAQMRAAIGLGKVLQAQGKHAEALKQFEAAVADGKSAAGVEAEMMIATLGRASAMAQTGKPAEAVKLVEGVIAKIDDPEAVEIFARAYTTLGACHRKLNQDKEAVLAYLHVHVLFSAHSESHAEALWNLAALWPKIDRRERAEEARTLLEENYGGTRWAKMPST